MTFDPQNIAQLRGVLYAAVVSDVLDALGFRDQVLDLQLQRFSGSGVLIGRAKTTQWEDVFQIDPKPYELELKAIDECQVDEILIVAAEGSTRSGVWGELMSTAARNRGCVGVIADGLVRDVAQMKQMEFNVFARGVCPRDSMHRQRVTAVDASVTIGGVSIASGDLIVADVDGVVVIPQAVEREALTKAWEKVTAENRVRDEIRAGMKATEVFRKYGVL